MPSAAALRPQRQIPRVSRAITGPSQEVLRHVRERAYDLALWERRLPAPVAAFCQKLTARRGSLELDATAGPGPELLAALALRAPFSRGKSEPAAYWLLEDIVALAVDFADVAGCAAVRVRLTKVPDRGCSVFHLDTLPVRLLCTYHGDGTQWADEPHVRRAELGLRGRTTGEANAAIVPSETRIRTMAAGAVAIFKGRLWPGAGSRGLVHRSYPVCCTDHARLRLVIDPAGHAY